MGTIHICGGNTLCGEVDIQGSKNGALPILAASILIKGRTILKNCPEITDVDHMLQLLEAVGCGVKRFYHTIEIDATSLDDVELPHEHANAMRSSVILLGALLAREKEAYICYPGGCLIGKRPIDIHIAALEQMGIEFCIGDNCIHAESASKKAVNTTIHLKFPSVGATENVILYGVLSNQVWTVCGCATEPEIVELCCFLNKAGAKIGGVGTNCITIEGVACLHEVCYRIMPDRIVAGTYLMAGAMTGGLVVLNQAPVMQMQSVFKTLQEMGADLAIAKDWVCLNGENAVKSLRYVKTDIYPDFPTDLQSACLVACCVAEGCSIIEETIFENRFQIATQLRDMGADIHILDRRAVVCGVKRLNGRDVYATELRGGAALVLAGLVACGDTYVHHDEYIKRGYENICRDLRALGAKIGEE